MSGFKNKTSEKSPAGTFLMTPAQHRAMAKMLREKFADDPETPQQANAHEKLADAIELRAATLQPESWLLRLHI